jgi:hypothetical protein
MQRSRPKRRRPQKAARPEPKQRPRPMADAWERFDTLLAEIDKIPDVPGSADPLDWDERGLPR